MNATKDVEMKSRIAGAVALLQPGEEIRFKVADLELDPHLSTPHGYNGSRWEYPDNVLESIVGSGYSLGYRMDWARNEVVFFRLRGSLENDPADRRSYVSPDRRTFYRYDGQLYTPRGAE